MKDIELKTRLQAHSENMKKSMESPFNITEKIDEMEMCDMTKKTVSFQEQFVNILKNIDNIKNLCHF